MAPARNTAKSGGVEYVEAGTPPAAEFYSDAHRDQYVRALEAESQGYAQRKMGAEENGGTDDNGVTAATWQRRIDGVQKELDRVTGDVEAGVKTVRGTKTPVDQVGDNE